jgi:hypothetical protein
MKKIMIIENVSLVGFTEAAKRLKMLEETRQLVIIACDDVPEFVVNKMIDQQNIITEPVRVTEVKLPTPKVIKKDTWRRDYKYHK